MNLRIAKKIRKHAQNVTKENLTCGREWSESSLARYRWNKVVEACHVVCIANDRLYRKFQKSVFIGIRRVAASTPIDGWVVKPRSPLGKIIVLS